MASPTAIRVARPPLLVVRGSDIRGGGGEGGGVTQRGVGAADEWSVRRELAAGGIGCDAGSTAGRGGGRGGRGRARAPLDDAFSPEL